MSPLLPFNIFTLPSSPILAISPSNVSTEVHEHFSALKNVYTEYFIIKIFMIPLRIEIPLKNTYKNKNAVGFKLAVFKNLCYFCFTLYP